jgi:hypothetical protein
MWHSQDAQIRKGRVHNKPGLQNCLFEKPHVLESHFPAILGFKGCTLDFSNCVNPGLPFRCGSPPNERNVTTLDEFDIDNRVPIFDFPRLNAALSSSVDARYSHAGPIDPGEAVTFYERFRLPVHDPAGTSATQTM